MKLEEISDRMEIQELLVTYCYAIDTHDWDALDEVFTPDAVIDYSEMIGPTGKGALPAIKAFLDSSFKNIVASQHMVATSQIKIVGDYASGKTICFNPIEMAPGGSVMLLGLWYRDEFVRTEKGWRISSRYEESSWRHNNPPGLLPEG